MRPILVALTLGWTLTTALAADQWIAGRQLLVRDPGRPDRRRVAGEAREWGDPTSAGGDPTVAGATLTIRADGDNPTEQTFPLPQGTDPNGKPLWAGSSTDGFRYRDPKGQQGPVSSVEIRKASSGLFRIRIKVSGRHAPLYLVPPNLGTGGCMLLELGDGDSYSVAFPTGTITNRGTTLFKVAWPPTKGTCVTLPPTTSTSTTTSITTASTAGPTTSTTSTTASTTTTTTSTTTTTASTTSTTASTTSTTTS